MFHGKLLVITRGYRAIARLPGASQGLDVEGLGAQLPANLGKLENLLETR